MNSFLERVQLTRRGRRACVAITLGCSLGALSACDGLLDVDLPASLTDGALDDPNGAQTLRNSVIGQFETAFDFLVWEFYSREDGGGSNLSSPGVARAGTDYEPSPGDWFDPLATSRRFAYELHDKLEDWTVAEVPGRAQDLAITSLYAGAAIGLMGSALCEASIDGGELMTPDQTLALAEDWLTKALSEIGSAGGDFALPYGISPSAQDMAYGLRAQVRWMRGDDAGAKADAGRVPQGFVAFVTRDAGPARRNKAYNDGPNIRYGELLGVHDWWEGSPNPVTGQPWPSVIPFTGYQNLGILPDGRAVRDDGLPIRTAGPYRTAVEDDAVADTRVPTIVGPVQGRAVETYIHNKYTSEDDDLPLVNWKEMWLIRAEIEGGQTAIDLVNEVRAADGLPLVTYLAPGNATGIRYMIIEERRRALFLEGRYLFTKIQNPDLLWFPRAEGRNPVRGGSQYDGAIRLLLPGDEYTLNRNLTDADRGTGCAAQERPVNIN